MGKVRMIQSPRIPLPDRRDAERPPSPPESESGDMDFSTEDAKKLWSLVWHRENLVDKKRSWLMGTSATSTSDSKPKRCRQSFFPNTSIPESYLRSDDVSFGTAKANVDKSFGLSIYGQESNHVVQDYQHLFDLLNKESNHGSPSISLKTFCRIFNDLNNNALFLAANIVTDNKISFVKNRPRMKKVIMECLEKVHGKSNCKYSPTLLKKLSQIFRNPSNFLEKKLTLSTPITQSLLSCIHKTLEEVDKMPNHDLIAVDRKLRGVTAVPKFPPVLFACKRELLIKRVNKRCKKFTLALKEGDDLPKPLCKALSVIQLSLKQRARRADILTSEFFPFTQEIKELQNDILKALWSLPKVKYDELKALKPLVDPQSKVARKTFRIILNKYLMQCLFECDETEAPAELVNALTFINSRSQRQLPMCSKETRDVEAILNMSSRLKLVTKNFLLGDSADESSSSAYSELEYDDNRDCNDFDLSQSNYCSNPGEQADQRTHGFSTYDDAEATGDSGYGNDFPRDMKIEAAKLDEDGDMNVFRSCPEEAIKWQPQHANQESGNMRNTTIQEICDESSLVSYKLIGHMLDTFMRIEGRDADAMTRCYLRGGSPLPTDSLDTEDLSRTSNNNTSGQILIQAVEDLLPSFPKRSLGAVKELIGMT